MLKYRGRELICCFYEWRLRPFHDSYLVPNNFQNSECLLMAKKECFHVSFIYWLLPQRSETPRKTKKTFSDDTFARITDLYFYSRFNQTHRLPRRAAYF